MNSSDSGNIQNIDGYFNLTEEGDGLYLSVFPPLGGEKVAAEEILQKIREKGYAYNDAGRLEAIIERANGREHLLIAKEAEPEEKTAAVPRAGISLEDAVTITVTNDAMKAYISIDWGINPNVKERDIKKALKGAGVIFGVSEAAIKRVLKMSSVSGELIASGIMPIAGKDSVFVKRYELTDAHSPKILENGNVDYRELELITGVNKGEVLLEKIPPTLGTPGKTVTGKEIAATNGKDLPFPRGKNVKASEDNTHLVADIDGAVSEDATGKINVEDVYVIKGNVDFSTGNIYHVGSLIVKGDVRPGFRVICNGDIEVLGSIEGALVTSKKGSIDVHKGIIGQQKAIITAAKDIKSFFIENAKVIASGNVTVREGVINSDLMAGDTVEIAGKNAVIIGGVCRAGCTIVADAAGSVSGNFTRLLIQPFNAKQIYAEILGLEKEYERVLKEMLQLYKIIEPVLKHKERLRFFSVDTQKGMKRNIKRYMSYRKHLSIITNKKAELKLKLIPRGGEYIAIRKKVYPKTTVEIMGYSKEIEEEIQFVKFYLRNQEIYITSFEGSKEEI